jgi:P-type conjugative transfer protein TrbL
MSGGSSVNALDNLIDQIRQLGDLLAGGMIPLGHNLVGHLAVVALVLAIAWPMLERVDLSPIIPALIGIIATCFLAIWLIDETPTITRAIDSSLIRAAATATGANPDLTPGQVLQQGFRMFDDYRAASASVSTWTSLDLTTAIESAFIGLGVIAGFIIIAATFAFYKILAYAIVPLTGPLIAMIVLPLTRGFAMGVFRFWIAVAVGLMVATAFAGMETKLAHGWIVALDAACNRQIIPFHGSPLTSMADVHSISACTRNVTIDTAAAYMATVDVFALLAFGATLYISHAVGVFAGHGLEHASTVLFASNQVSRVASSVTNNSATQGGAAARDAAWAKVKETIQNSIP